MIEPERIADAGAPAIRCDSEPIHSPAAVQAHGGLLAFDPDDLRVAYRSENAAELLGLAVDPLGARIDGLISALARETIVEVAEASIAELIPARVFLRSAHAADVTAHRSDGLIVAEFERTTQAEMHAALLHETRRAVERVEMARDIDGACTAGAEEVRRLTGYRRVMVYRFHEDEHGEIVAEARREDAEPYLGTHYPASDISRPARRLLRLSPTRLIADVERTAEAIAGHDAFGARPLDLSRSALRAASPLHVQYLRSIGVAASLTIAIADGPRLWGLVVCHHDEPKLPSPELRSACAIVARALWLKIDAQQRLDEHSEDQRRLSLQARFLATVSSAASLAEALVADGRSLLELVGADGVSVRIDDVGASLGAIPAREQIAALVECLGASHASSPAVTNDSEDAFRELGLETATAAGILAIPGPRGWQEHVIWFRRETEHGRAPAWSRSDRLAAAELLAALPAVSAARARDALAQLALRDSLTGLPNRALLLDRIEVAIAELGRNGRSLWILFLDLDGFKEVNDSLGHEAGDHLLAEMGSRLRHCVRASDTVARLGGDEFVIVCSEDATQEDVDHLAARLLASLRRPLDLGGRECAVTASIGIATVDGTVTPAEALAAADAAMYRAKRQGRNRAVR
jgi:diguanylate cyclase (GGDEF)-like protein